jgi:hypothetical protein
VPVVGIIQLLGLVQQILVVFPELVDRSPLAAVVLLRSPEGLGAQQEVLHNHQNCGGNLLSLLVVVEMVEDTLAQEHQVLLEAAAAVAAVVVGITVNPMGPGALVLLE